MCAWNRVKTPGAVRDKRERATQGVKIVVGLGNPGARYAHTRHNVGFDTLDLLAEQQGWPWSGRRHHAVLAEGALGGDKVLLAKPQTYMNDSGLAVGDIVRFYKLDLSDLLVVCDDLDLPLGKIRVRARGASGGQHGLESIIQHLGGKSDFPRVRIGIGRPRNGRSENVDFLLSRAGGDERIELASACERAAEAVRAYLVDGIDVAMNRFNGGAGGVRQPAPTGSTRDENQ
jgi:PTH1 family peptidyl-tRNA hydrolase